MERKLYAVIHLPTGQVSLGSKIFDNIRDAKLSVRNYHGTKFYGVGEITVTVTNIQRHNGKEWVSDDK